jgi:hypothetical protein
LTTAVDAQGLGISTQNITNQAAGAAAIAALQGAVSTLGTAQGRVGSAMNRLQYAVSQAQTMSAAVSASESRIRDANLAEEAANLEIQHPQPERPVALAQANQTNASVLMLLLVHFGDGDDSCSRNYLEASGSNGAILFPASTESISIAFGWYAVESQPLKALQDEQTKVQNKDSAPVFSARSVRFSSSHFVDNRHRLRMSPRPGDESIATIYG